MIESDLVPPRDQSIIEVCPVCKRLGLPPKPDRLCEVCLKCGDHCECGIPAL